MPTVTLYELDPADCRPPAGRALPREHEYRNLVNSLRRHGQIVPAIVRPLAPCESHKYEIVAGLHRHRAITHLRGLGWGLGLQLAFLAEIGSPTGAQSLQLAEADHERQTACPDYYRACNYAYALQVHYGGSQKNMADHLSMSAPVLSRYLTLAALPTAIFRAYGEPDRVSITHAGEVAEVQEIRRQRRQDYLPPSSVHARLLRAAGVDIVRTARPRAHGVYDADETLGADGRNANGLVAVELFKPRNYNKSLAASTEILGAIPVIATS